MKYTNKIWYCLLILAIVSNCQHARSDENSNPVFLPTDVSLTKPMLAETQVPVADLAKIRSQVQAVVDDITTLQATQNMALIDSIVDPNLPHLANAMRKRTEDLAAIHSEAAIFRVDNVKMRTSTLVLAHITHPASGSITTWPFRLIHGSWRITEPTNDELGKQFSVATPHITIFADEWSAELLPDLEQVASLALQDVQKMLPDTNVPPITMTITTSGMQFRKVHDHAIGSFEQGENGRSSQIMIINPYSYTVGFFKDTGWKPEYRKLIAHEYVHYITTQQYSINIRQVPTWMFEGVAEYVSEPDNKEFMLDLLKRKNIVSIIPNIGQTETIHNWSWNNDPNDGYIISNAAVEYCIEKYGGIDAYWELMQAYQETQSYSAALDQVYSISVQEFNRQWLSWITETYH